MTAAAAAYYTVTVADATNFYIGDVAGAWGNDNGLTLSFSAL